MNVMKNYKEKLESLIEDLNILCLEHNNSKENPGRFKLIERKIPSWENKFMETIQDARIAIVKANRDNPLSISIREKLNLKETIRLIIIYEEDYLCSLDGKDRHIMIQHETEYFQSDRERVEDYMYKGLYYEFLKYTLFAKEFNSKDSKGMGIRIIPVRDLIVYGLNKG